MTHGFPAAFTAPYKSKPEGPGIVAQLWNPRGSWGHDSIPEEKVELAKHFAEKWTTREAWRQDVERKARAALGEKNYRRSRSRSTLRMCKQLAKEAEFLLHLTVRAERTIEDAVSPALEWIMPPALRRIIAQSSRSTSPLRLESTLLQPSRRPCSAMEYFYVQSTTRSTCWIATASGHSPSPRVRTR